MAEFASLTALVTDGCGGIGAATAALLQGHGARVAFLEADADNPVRHRGPALGMISPSLHWRHSLHRRHRQSGTSVRRTDPQRHRTAPGANPRMEVTLLSSPSISAIRQWLPQDPITACRQVTDRAEKGPDHSRATTPTSYPRPACAQVSVALPLCHQQTKNSWRTFLSCACVEAMRL